MSPHESCRWYIGSAAWTLLLFRIKEPYHRRVPMEIKGLLGFRRSGQGGDNSIPVAPVTPRRRAVHLVLAALMGAAPLAAPAQGVTKTTILVGQSGPLSGS